MKKLVYSWILPIKNEGSSLPQLLAEIIQTMENPLMNQSELGWEIIAINDASTDNTKTILGSLAIQIRQLKIIQFLHHQGKWAALLAGFKASRGQIIIALDSDLQDNPNEAIKLVTKLNQGYDLVSGARIKRHDPLYKVIVSRLGNWLASILTGHHFKDLNSPFKIYKRAILEDLPKQGTMLRFTILFAEKLGYKVAEVPVNHRPRLYGKSKFGMVKYARILYDLVLVLLLFTGSGRLSRQRK